MAEPPSTQPAPPGVCPFATVPAREPPFPALRVRRQQCAQRRPCAPFPREGTEGTALPPAPERRSPPLAGVRGAPRSASTQLLPASAWWGQGRGDTARDPPPARMQATPSGGPAAAAGWTLQARGRPWAALTTRRWRASRAAARFPLNLCGAPSAPSRARWERCGRRLTRGRCSPRPRGPSTRSSLPQGPGLCCPRAALTAQPW